MSAGSVPRLTSLVLPAYNPGAAVVASLARVRAFFDRERRPWEAVLVCDGCTDGTPERARAAVADDTRFRVVEYAANRGKGYAVRTGLSAARGEFRLFTDIDLGYFEGVRRVASRLWEGAAVAIASRRHQQSLTRVAPGLTVYAARRYAQSRAFAAAARLLLPIAHTDTQAGLKGMTAAVARAVLPHLTCDGFALDCELLTACARSGIEVEDVPLETEIAAAESTVGWRRTVRTLGELVEIRRRWPAGRAVAWQMPGDLADAA